MELSFIKKNQDLHSNIRSPPNKKKKKIECKNKVKVQENSAFDITLTFIIVNLTIVILKSFLIKKTKIIKNIVVLKITKKKN